MSNLAVAHDAPKIRAPYLILIGDTVDRIAAKTALGIQYWRPQTVAGQLRFSNKAIDLNVPDLTLHEAAARDIKTLVIGISPPGGRLPDAWIDTIVDALALGFDIASGLHTRLDDIPAIRAATAKSGRKLFDVRFPSGVLTVAKGARRPGKRLLTVGTDCSVGKMYTALAIERELRGRGHPCDFRATGQTGILISGSGLAVDAVIADFIAGAAEGLSPPNDARHWDIIEGQGSLFHPSYAGVSLGLLHGSQPDALVLCHEVGRTEINAVPGYNLPGLNECIALNLQLARLTNPAVQCVGVAANTSSLDDVAAARAMKEITEETGLPCVDPVRTGVSTLVDQLLEI